jgi:hypothetical protein
VAGGKRQYFKQGVRLAQALLLPRQIWWEKVRGLQPSYENTAPTLWKLVDKRSRKRVVPAVPLAQAGVGDMARIVHEMAAHPAEVGVQAATGVPCPASGWWRCQEAQALDATRWFAQGSLLPPATFPMPAGASRKTVGAPGIIQRRVVWQLVRLTPAADEAGDC